MKRTLVLSLFLVAASAAAAQVHDQAPPTDSAASGSTAPGVAALSPDLRAPFRAELAGLQGTPLERFPAFAPAHEPASHAH